MATSVGSDRSNASSTSSSTSPALYPNIQKSTPIWIPGAMPQGFDSARTMREDGVRRLERDIKAPQPRKNIDVERMEGMTDHMNDRIEKSSVSPPTRPKGPSPSYWHIGPGAIPWQRIR